MRPNRECFHNERQSVSSTCAIIWAAPARLPRVSSVQLRWAVRVHSPHHSLWSLQWPSTRLSANTPQGMSRASPSSGAPPASIAQAPCGQAAYGQFGQGDVQNGPSSTVQMQRLPGSQPFGSPLAPVGNQPAVLQPYGPPPTSAQVTAQLSGMQISGAVAPAPPSSGLGYGPPTSLASASGSFPNSGLYGSYPQGQAPPLSQAQGHPGIQTPQRSAPSQASGFIPPASGVLGCLR